MPTSLSKVNRGNSVENLLICQFPDTNLNLVQFQSKSRHHPTQYVYTYKIHVSPIELHRPARECFINAFKEPPPVNYYIGYLTGESRVKHDRVSKYEG